jgi:hypothetical protein
VLPDSYPSIVDKGWASKVGITGIPFADAGGFPNINFDERYSGFGVNGTGGLQGTDGSSSTTRRRLSGSTH